MFARKPGVGSAPVPTQPSRPPRLPVIQTRQSQRAGNARSVIGPDLCIIGNLESPGEVLIEGVVQGDVFAGRILVGPQGLVTGTLTADEIIVGGAVQGSVRGNRVTLQSGSHVEGDVAHSSLTIEQGAYFEGKSRRVEHPIAARAAARTGDASDA